MSQEASSTIWVTGAGGLIGHHVVQAAPPRPDGRRIRAWNRSELDLLDFRAVDDAFEQDDPAAVIHCAAMSKSAACQADPALAWQINLDATRHLAELAVNIPFIFFSTDLVFDGSQGQYLESDPVRPLTVYGETKAAAEERVLQNARHTVLRTTLNAGRSPTGDRSFNEEMHRAWMAGKTLRLFTDELRCPIPAALTARAVWELLEADCTGLYHLAGSEKLSRYAIGTLLAELYREAAPRWVPASVQDYEGPPRSPDTSLDCTKIQRRLSFPLPRFSEWVRTHPDALL